MGLFNKLNEEGVTYCVLRNYDELPENVGNDVDIWIKEGDQGRFRECIFETAKKNRWDLVKYSQRPSLKGEGDYFYANNENDLVVIHLDCWSFLYWRGVSYIDEDCISSNLKLHEKGFWRPSEGIEASILLLKDLLYHKHIPDKYKERIREFASIDVETFIHAVQKPFGEQVSKDLITSVRAADWDELRKKSGLFRWLLMKRGLFRTPVDQLYKWMIYIYSTLLKYLLPRNGLFIVLIGPDGSGKSTTAKKLLASEIKGLFQKKQYLHGHFPFLPELKKIANFAGRKKVSASPFISQEELVNGCKSFSAMRAMIYPLYYGIEYFLGHFTIWVERARGGLVLFDRYFYDYFIQKPYENCPRWLLLLIAKIIPKPDILIFLRNEPEIIHDRKPELSIEEIARQVKLCEEIVKKLKSGHVIETSLSQNEVVRHIQSIIVTRIKEKAGTG